MTDGQVELIRRLRSPDNKAVRDAVDELRRQSALTAGTLGKIDLRYANFQGANLREADLAGIDLRMANFEGADLSHAKLCGTKLRRANLSASDLARADLREADLFNADLEAAQNLADEQLLQASRLRMAIMPDGEPYDGRYSLFGDLRDAEVLRLNLNDSHAMAGFYGIAVEAYAHGQVWAQRHLAHIRREVEQRPAGPEAQLITRLRDPDRRVASQALNELRQLGLLDGGALKGANLQQAILKEANLNFASLEGADLSGTDLSGADLSLANLHSASLCQAVLQRARLLWAGLQSADLSGADLREANLTGANLRAARLDHANLQGADFSATNLKKADLLGADLTGARNLSETELARAHRLWGAALPDGSLYDGRFNLAGDADFSR